VPNVVLAGYPSNANSTPGGETPMNVTSDAIKCKITASLIGLISSLLQSYRKFPAEQTEI
jgi:hypothetical protein